MKYLYGDATPFPLTENFLVTLCAATEASVALLRADELVDSGNRAVQETDARVTKELAALDAVARRIEESLGANPPVVAPDAGPVQLAAARIAEHAWATLERTRAEVLGLRESAVAASSRAAPHAKVLPALSAFLTAHQLPETTWSIRWGAEKGVASASAEVFSRAHCGLEATFGVEIPVTHLWSRSPRVNQLEREVTIQMMRKPWLRKPRPCPVRLDKLFVASVTHTPEDARMTLVHNPKRQEGIEIVLRSGSSTGVTATRLDKQGEAVGEPEVLDATDSAEVKRLWARVESTLGELVLHRTGATEATLGGVQVGDIVHPEVIAEVVIGAVAPIIREIVRRSASPRELSLKRTLGDGRREELFVSFETVLDRTAGLSERHRAMFDAFGLRERSGARGVVHRLPSMRSAPELRAVSA
ncbi:hypothetical protein [Chondromyces crocatus]|uniref:Uncharacterized protein n=1 Tax=Chondromyces crocatus TaxID=52 RepID=A0A0K1ERJ6_CHOCO|nr:hypothetical protein [Chondromyces crocatus]AKT43233.1 uncharacterized protein CMC5_074640 [Chondromyces crocatus]